MANPKLSADLSHREEGHDGKVDPHLVLLSVGHLDGEVAVDRDELQLGIRHDTVSIEGLSRLVEPYGFIRPPKGEIGPVSIPCVEIS